MFLCVVATPKRRPVGGHCARRKNEGKSTGASPLLSDTGEPGVNLGVGATKSWFLGRHGAQKREPSLEARGLEERKLNGAVLHFVSEQAACGARLGKWIEPSRLGRSVFCVWSRR